MTATATSSTSLGSAATSSGCSRTVAPTPFPAVFDVAKRVLSECDEEARSLVCDGFVGDLTSTEMFVATSVTPTDFLPWLGRLVE
jgi:hypothetical protein